jgi:polar amino acid transport system substrate-binding protein
VEGYLQGIIMLNLNRINLILCWLLSVTVVSFSSVAADVPEKKTLKVGFMSSIKRIEDNHYIGALPDIIREIVNHTDYSLALQAMPIKRLLKSLETGQVDAVIGLFKRDDRLAYSDYLDTPIGWVCANIFRLRSDASITANPTSLRHKKIGLLRGANWGKQLDDVLKEQKAYPTQVSNYDMLAKMLDKGRFDAVIASRDAFKSAARRQNLDEDYVTIPLTYSKSLGMYILVSKKSPHANKGALIQQLNIALITMKETRQINEIYRRNGKTFDEHCKQ